jgi:c-di-AMP phosphodiesterase-like protein
MDFTNDIRKIKELLEKTPEVLIVTHENPTHDSIGSALALSLGLTSLGKNVLVACPDPMTVELSGYIGAQKVVSAIGKKNFVISLDYVDGSIEKVSYNIEGDKFNLVIEPRPGFDVFSEEKVHFSHAGSSAGVIITVDTIHLGGLKKLFDDDKDMFASKPIVNVDRHANNAHYGHTNMVDDKATSTAEVVAALLTGLGVTMTEDIATNLLNALIGATNNFQNQNVSAGTFETAASLMKAGATRFRVPPTGEQTGHTVTPPVTQPVRSEQAAPQAVPSVQPPTQQSTQQPVSQPQQQVQPSTQPPAAQPPAPVKQQKAPPDWLKPKIFKSSNIA